MGKSTISMAIFHSYVNLPEGIPGWINIGSAQTIEFVDLQMCKRHFGII